MPEPEDPETQQTPPTWEDFTAGSGPYAAQAPWPHSQHAGYSGRPGTQWVPGGGWTAPPPPPPFFTSGQGWWSGNPVPAATITTTTDKKGRWAAAAVVAAGLLAAGAVGGVIGHAMQSAPSASSASSGATNPSNGSSPGGSSPFNGFPSVGGGSTPSGGTGGSGPSDAASIASKVDAGLVDINTTIDYGRAEGAGTGMVLTANGEVLTNNHVIDGATSISVTDVGNGRTYSATVVGYDRTVDVAVLQLSGASGLKTVSLGDSSRIGTGEQVVGVGNAGGAGGTPSYAGGTVTALNQAITATDDLTGTSEQLTGMIETNADIQPGDSGGPLVNSSGQVIGIDTAGSSSSFTFQVTAGTGYAIPINKAISVAGQITAGTSSATVHIGPTAFLGVQIDVGEINSGASGATISGTVSGSPAYGAGMTGGDVITSLGGQPVTSNNDLETVLQQDRPGQTVQIQYTDSSGQQHTATVTLASGPPA